MQDQNFICAEVGVSQSILRKQAREAITEPAQQLQLVVQAPLPWSQQLQEPIVKVEKLEGQRGFEVICSGLE